MSGPNEERDLQNIEPNKFEVLICATVILPVRFWRRSRNVRRVCGRARAIVPKTAQMRSSRLLVTKKKDSKTMTTKRVTFHNTVLVREHYITLGDNPACSLGAPLALGEPYRNVQYSLEHRQTVQEARYDAAIAKRKRLRSKHEWAPHGPPITQLNYYQRRDMLQAAGFSSSDLQQAERNVKRIQRQRSSSYQGTLPQALFNEAPRRVWHKWVQGQGTTRHKRTLIKAWYVHYDNNANNGSPRPTTTTTKSPSRPQ